MKRTTKKVEKRTFTLQNALPRFVSIVSRGANFTPLAELRFADENEKFSDVEINRIVFSKEKFSTKEAVEAYLNENDYAEYSIEETETTYVVPGVESEAFSEISPIEYGDGVEYFVGKLAAPSGEEQATSDVVEAEVLDFQEPQDEVTTEEVQASDPEESDEEDEAEGEEDDGEKSDEDESEEDGADPIEAVAATDPELENTNEDEPAPEEVVQPELFNEKLYREKAEAALAAFNEALANAMTESFSLPAQEDEVEVFTAEQVEAKVNEAIEAYKEQQIKETEQNTIDDTPVLVQNRHSVEPEEIQETVSRDKTENEKFSERKMKDLFGL